MKKSNQYIKIALVIVCIGLCVLPVFAMADIPGPQPGDEYGPIDYYNSRCYWRWGDVGDLLFHDEDTMKFLCTWYWWFQTCYVADVYFYFNNFKYYELTFDFTDNGIRGYINLYAYYTTGSPQFLGSFDEGIHTIDLDSGRALDRIGAFFFEGVGLFWELWDRYIYFNEVTAVVA